MIKEMQLRTATFVSISVLTIAAAAGALEPPVAGRFDPVTVDRFITAQVARHGIPGLAVAITRSDQVVFVRGYGLAREGEPVSGRTQFRIASLSKSFTALAVLQLVEAGKIALDAPVTLYLTDFNLTNPSVAARITVRQLLNHTSGMADLGFVKGLNGQQETLTDRVASVGAARAIDLPGASFHYFDPNYQVLARLVEVVSRQPFDAYLQQHVFRPLDMRSSVSALTSAVPAAPNQLAQGHVMGYGMALALPELSGFLGGSGGLVSTAADMANYLIAQGNYGRYLGRSVLSANGVSLMQTPPAGVDTRYAMGWTTSARQQTKTLEHSGVLSTFYADAVLLPESGYGFVLLYNAYALTATTGAFPDIKNGLIAVLTGQAPVTANITLPELGRGLAALSVVIAALAVWGLLRLPRWKALAGNAPRWKLGWGLLWPLVPALLLLGLPRLLALQSGRYFEPVMLLRAMPELMILLGVCGALGLLNSVVRFAILARLSA